MPGAPTLVTIPLSHYCEMARFGLDYAGVPWREERHLQVFSRAYTRRKAGYDHVPLLLTDEGPVKGSIAILREASKRASPSRALFFDELQPAIDELLAELDAYGEDIRRVAYHLAFRRMGSFLRINEWGAPLAERLSIRALAPMMSLGIKRHFSIDEASVASSLARMEALWGRVEAMLDDGRPYLLGDTLTAVDISYAALSALATWPERYGAPLGPSTDLDPEYQALQARFRATKAGGHALKLYDEAHRPWPSNRG